MSSFSVYLYVLTSLNQIYYIYPLNHSNRLSHPILSTNVSLTFHAGTSYRCPSLSFPWTLTATNSDISFSSNPCCPSNRTTYCSFAYPVTSTVIFVSGTSYENCKGLESFENPFERHDEGDNTSSGNVDNVYRRRLRVETSTEEEGEADQIVLVEDDDDEGRLGRRGILICNCGLKGVISGNNEN